MRRARICVTVAPLKQLGARPIVISETRRRLKEWGRWACGDEPSLGSNFKTHVSSRGAQDLRELPPHIAEVDHIVCTAAPSVRRILCGFYGSSGSYADKADRLMMDPREFKRAIDRADYYVHSRLDEIPREGVEASQTAVTRRKSVRNTPSNPIP